MEIGDKVQFKESVTGEMMEAHGVNPDSLGPILTITAIDFRYFEVNDLFYVKKSWLEESPEE